MATPDITQYLGRQTVLAGDVSSVKTTKSTVILKHA